MSEQEPRRFEFLFDAETEASETDRLRISMNPDGARCVLGCIENGLAAGNETITVTIPGWMEDKGPR